MKNIALGNEKNGLCQLETSTAKKIYPATTIPHYGSNEELLKWHNMLGHTSYQVLQKIPAIKLVNVSHNSPHCPVFPLAKQHKLNNKQCCQHPFEGRKIQSQQVFF